MPYRPLTDSERAKIQARISTREGKISSLQSSVCGLQAEMERGAWYSNADYSALPPPALHCYLCVHSYARICRKGCTYGKVCEDYAHFTWKEVSRGKDA